MSESSLHTGFGIETLGAPANTGDLGPRANIPSELMLSRHRAWGAGLPLHCDVTQTSVPLVIAVGGGKGGVGKSMISANLAAQLARSGFSVVALDLDCGGSNLHTYFGINGQKLGLSDFIVRNRCSFRDLLVPTSVERLSIVTAYRDDAWSVADVFNQDGMGKLWSGIVEHRNDSVAGCDVVILDLGAGAARHTIDLFSMAHVGVITSLPEPTSVENSYLFLRTLLLRLIENSGRRLGMDTQAREVIRFITTDEPGAQSKSYTEKLRLLYQSNPTVVGPLASALGGRMIGLVMNQTRSQADIDVGRAMEMAVSRYFGFIAQYLGYLNYDEAAWKALRNRRLLTQDFPQAQITRKINEVVKAILQGVGL